MTGEVSLTGRVLPIGGVKQKLLAAHRAGVTTVIIPKRNEADLDDVPAEVLEKLDVHAVTDVRQVLELALAPADQRRGAGGFGGRVTEVAGREGPGPVREARAFAVRQLCTSARYVTAVRHRVRQRGAGPQPVASALTRSRAPLNLSWSPTVGPDDVYCQIV